MNRTSLYLAAGLTLALFTVGASAQAGGHGRGQGPMAERGPVSLAEAEQRTREQAAAMDANGDGYITAEEAFAWHEAKRAERQKKMFERRHGSDRITVEDFVAQRQARLAKLDANGDGVIDAEERQAARKAMREAHHGKGRGEGYGERRKARD
jgi:hypothetical protein